MANTVVRERILQFNFTRYFRAGAEDVLIGSTGRKKTPAIGANRLEVKDQVPMGTVKSAKAVVVDIDFTKTTKGAFKRNSKVATAGQAATVSASGLFEGLRTGQLKLVKFGVLPNRMRDAANSSSRILKELAIDDARARIAHEIFVVMKAELANSFGVRGQVDVDVSVTAEGVTAKGTRSASGSASGQTKVILSEGTTFAYHLLKLKWNAKAKKKRTHIVDVREDQAGLN